MAQPLSLSVKGTKKNPIVAYFDYHLDRDIDHFNQAEEELREELYDRMDEIVKEGLEIIERREVKELLLEDHEVGYIVEEVQIEEERFIEIRDKLKEEGEL